MKNLILLLIAVILFSILSLIAIPYTAIYYIKYEKEKKRPYLYMVAFGIDVFGNITMGEFFELIFAKKRGCSSFGKAISISACIGELIIFDNFKTNKQWFLNILNFAFNEKNHCINAYYSEIR